MSLRKNKEADSFVKVVPALQVDEDHWLLVQNEGPRKVMGKWLVVLMGPNVKLGQWTLMSGTAQGLESMWRWDMRKPKSASSSWMFYGRKPEYRDGRWTFVSERPELFYTSNGKVLGSRFTLNQLGELIVADNSEASYKLLSSMNEKGGNKVLVSISTEEKKPVAQEEKKTTPVEETVPLQNTRRIDGEFEKVDWGNVRSLANEFKDRLQSKISAAAQDGGNPLFHPVASEQEKMTFLNEGTKTRAMTEIWSKDRKHRMNANLTHMNQASNLLTASVQTADSKNFIGALKALDDVTCLFSVNLHQVQLFFVSSLLGFNNSACQFELPTNVYEVQRRFSLRYSFSSDTKVRVEFDNPRLIGDRLSKVMIDVSSGGLAMRASPTEKELFKQGQELKNIVFKVGDREVKTNADVRHATLIEPQGAEAFLKVGLSFKNVKPRDSNFLNQFVYEQSLMYLSKLR
jgi:hypothetical protein